MRRRSAFWTVAIAWLSHLYASRVYRLLWMARGGLSTIE
jgi:hypothetical protein